MTHELEDLSPEQSEAVESARSETVELAERASVAVESTAHPSGIGRLTAAPSESELSELRRDLARFHGAAYWKRLEELSTTEVFGAFLKHTFPALALRPRTAIERRDFLRLMGASLAVAGLSACTRQPDEKIAPFARSPEATIPGRPRFFATAMAFGGDALGLLVESHMGRPTKVEGNPDHPSSLGATDVYAQAAILALVDPDRSHSILRAGQIATWDAFLTELGLRMDGVEARAGEGLALLSGENRSPTLAAQLSSLLERFPRARLHHWTPVHRDHARQGARLAFGRELEARYRFDRATVVLALDADFLASGPGGVRYARDFAAARRARAGAGVFGRLYSVESSVTLTGAMADQRLALRPSEIESFARLLAGELEVPVELGDAAQEAGEELQAFARAVANDLRRAGTRAVLVPGEGTSPVVHAIAHLANHALGAVGTTVELSEPILPLQEGALDSIRSLVGEMRAGNVKLLVMLGGNPVYDAPADLEFAQALDHVPFRAHLSLFVDETSRLCHWHLPLAHFLESWSDAAAYDGTTALVQPLIAPLYGGRTAHEIVAALAGERSAKSHDIVRAHWKAARGARMDEQEFERFWRTALHDGVVPETTRAVLDAKPLSRADLGPASAAARGTTRFEVSFRPDASTYDGRFANNGWLQETPRPMTRIVWDNAALVSPRTAEGLGVGDGAQVEIVSKSRRLEAPIWIVPGHPHDVLTLHLGYGRTSAGELGSRVGFDAYRLRDSGSSWQVAGVEVRPLGSRMDLVSVQDHARMEGRDLVRVSTFDRFAREAIEPAPTPHDSRSEAPLPSLYPPFRYEGHAWGMVIDLNACIGCNACMVACQAENNVPVVGKKECANGREMHWIRIDRYFEDRPLGGDPLVLHQPVPCMHCENAPCELVCPVGATVHSDEGLNEMVYNRCVGTRYCSNNCPYKVRRFNFFRYADYETESLKLGNNPDVTVRSRGVMEKCTYCVQRINHARITAKKEERAIHDGEIQTACQQVCPTQAIVFGDINDERSAVSALRREPHHYALLGELGTRPRTTYLEKLRHPNPELENA